jgi:hypothetical protein
LPPGGVLDGKSVRQLDDPPRRRKAGDHVLSAGRRGRLYLGRFGCPGLALLVGATGYGLRPLAAGGLLRLACFLLAKSISRACRRAAIGLERRLPRRRSGPMLAPHCTNTALARRADRVQRRTAHHPWPGWPALRWLFLVSSPA